MLNKLTWLAAIALVFGVFSKSDENKLLELRDIEHHLDDSIHYYQAQVHITQDLMQIEAEKDSGLYYLKP